MAYDEGLAQRMREFIDARAIGAISEKKMFGGICFMVSGNIACGIIGDNLIVRVGPDQYAETLNMPNVVKFDITGRPMKGWVMVTPDGYEADADLAQWIETGINFARSLPPK